MAFLDKVIGYGDVSSDMERLCIRILFWRWRSNSVISVYKRSDNFN